MQASCARDSPDASSSSLFRAEAAANPPTLAFQTPAIDQETECPGWWDQRVQHVSLRALPAFAALHLVLVVASATIFGPDAALFSHSQKCCRARTTRKGPPEFESASGGVQIPTLDSPPSSSSSRVRILEQQQSAPVRLVPLCALNPHSKDRPRKLARREDPSPPKAFLARPAPPRRHGAGRTRRVGRRRMGRV